MQIPKQQILDMLRTDGEPGRADQAEQADRDLPQQVDTDNAEHQNMLQQFGVDPMQLVKKFGGGLLG